MTWSCLAGAGRVAAVLALLTGATAPACGQQASGQQAGGQKTGAAPAPKPEILVLEAAGDYPPLLRELGLRGTHAGGGDAASRETPLRCYYYGDGGQGVAFSEAFLAPYRARGFSQLSLCMGLVGGMRFDPETGQPIPRYSMVSRRALRQKVLNDGLTGDGDDQDVASLDLPLAVPDCFRNATPYTDCAFNYDLMSGKRLPAETTAAYRKLGAALDRLLESFRAAPDCGWREAGMERDDCRLALPGVDVHGFRPDGYYLTGRAEEQADAALRPPAKLLALSAATFFHVADALPRGFGYALHAEGPAGPSIAVTAIKQGLDGNAISPQIDPKSLIRKLNLQKN